MEELRSELALTKQEKEIAEYEKEWLADLLHTEKASKLQCEGELLQKVAALEKEVELQNVKMTVLGEELKLATERFKIASSKLRSIADSLENEGEDCLGSGTTNVPEADRELTEIKIEPVDTLSPGSVAAVTPAPPPSTSEVTFIQSVVGTPLPFSSLFGETKELENEGVDSIGAGMVTAPEEDWESMEIKIEPVDPLSPDAPQLPSSSVSGDTDLDVLMTSDDPEFGDDGDSQASVSSDFFSASSVSMNSYFGLFTPVSPSSAISPSNIGGRPVEAWVQSLTNAVANPASVLETLERRQESIQRSQRAPVPTPAVAPSSRPLLVLASELPEQPPAQHGAVGVSKPARCICGKTLKNVKGLARHIAYFKRKGKVPCPKARSAMVTETPTPKGEHMKRKHGNDSNPGQEDPVPVKRIRGGA